MRGWPVILTVMVGCASSDDGANDDDPGTDDDPIDTDTTDTDTTDTDTSDTDLPPTQECLFDPCGGDVVSSWYVQDMCFAQVVNPFTPVCADSTYVVDIDATGEFDFNKDMTWESYTAYSLTVVATFPSSCNGAVSACSDWTTQVAGLELASCEGDVAVSCTCTMPFGESVPTTDNGTWAYVGDDLEIQSLTRGEGGPAGPVRYEYCRDGDALTLRQKGIPLPLVIQIELVID